MDASTSDTIIAKMNKRISQMSMVLEKKIITLRPIISFHVEVWQNSFSSAFSELLLLLLENGANSSS